MVFQLLRSYHRNGTNGELFHEGKKICNTIELPWKDNVRTMSCIPEGTYTLQKRYSLKNGWHIHVMNVPDRKWILIHCFNNALEESQGCIAPVEKIESAGVGRPARPCLNRLMALMEPAFLKRQTIFLIIKKNEHAKHDRSASPKKDAKVL